MFGLVGSGRTETFKVVAGLIKRDFFHGGEVLLRGRPVRYRVPRQAVRDGIVYVTEDRKIEGFFETMSIAENIYIGLARQARQRLRLGVGGEGARRSASTGSGAQHPRDQQGRARSSSCPAATSRRW